MSLVTRTRAGARNKAGNVAALGRRARQSQQAQRAAAQVAPLARSAQMTARQGIDSARAWTAPRLDQTGRLIQERAAPRLSEMMSTAARKIEPSRPRRRRWPMLVIGIAAAAGGSVAAALALSRRGSSSAAGTNGESEAAPSSTERERADSEAPADINRHAHTS